MHKPTLSDHPALQSSAIALLAALACLSGGCRSRDCHSTRTCEGDKNVGGLGGKAHEDETSSGGRSKSGTGGTYSSKSDGGATTGASGGKPSELGGRTSGHACDPGYTERGAKCVDINECEDEPCSENALCHNSPGSYSCSCASGFYAAEDACWPDMVLVSATGENAGTNARLELPTLSADGRVVAFAGLGSSFGLDTDEETDILTREMHGGVLSIQSLPPGDAVAPSLSANGNMVAFSRKNGNSTAGADVYMRDRAQPSPTLVSVDSTGALIGGSSGAPSMSADGRRVAFTSSGGSFDSHLFVRDVSALTTTEPLKVEENALYGRATLSGGGNVVAVSCDSSCDPAFARDLEKGLFHVLCDRSTADYCFVNSISHDGRYVLFSSAASTLTPEDTNNRFDVFLRDLVEDTTNRVSVSTAGDEADGDSAEASISADGRYVLFSSSATNLVPGDTNGKIDVFLRDLREETTRRVSVGPEGQQGNEGSEAGGAALSADGRFAVFVSSATNFGAETYSQRQIWYKRILP